MSNGFKKYFAAAALLLSLHLAQAQSAGHVVANYDSSNYPLWNLSGGYVFDTPLQGGGSEPVPLSYSLLVDHQARGPLQGQGTIMVRIGNEVAAGSYTLRGTVSGNGQLTRVNFTINIRGKGWLSGANRDFRISANYRLEVEPDEFALVGRVSGTSRIAGFGSAKQRDDDVVIPLPNGVDGSWYLAMDFVPFKSFSGTGAIVTSAYVSPENPVGWPTERVMQATVKGSYNAKRDVTTARLTTTRENKGASLSISYPGGEDYNIREVATIRGKVLGQTIRIAP